MLLQRTPSSAVTCSARSHHVRPLTHRTVRCQSARTSHNGHDPEVKLTDSPEVVKLEFEPQSNGGPTAAAAASQAAAGTASAAATQATGSLKMTGLRRAPLSGGVKTATSRFDLPAPSVAVRNLVEQVRLELEEAREHPVFTSCSHMPAAMFLPMNAYEGIYMSRKSTAHYAHLCTVMSNMHHRRAGYPFGTLVDFACDGSGYPIFCLSPLAIHARNIMEDPRTSMVVQMPGWTGLANARVTIFGDIYPLPQELQRDAQDMFLAKFANQERWVTGNFLYFRMHRIVDIYFVGGFGTVQWIDPVEYLACEPDAIVMNSPQRTLQVLNDTYASSLRDLCYPGSPADDAAFISIDASGADIRVRHGADLSIERVGFDVKVQSLEDALVAIGSMIQRGGKGAFDC